MIKAVNYAKIIGVPLIAGGFMQINNTNKRQQIDLKGVKYIPEGGKVQEKTSNDKSDMLIGELDKMSTINNVGIKKPEFELGLSREELEKRTHKDYLTTKKMLDVDATEYAGLSDGDKEELKHLNEINSCIIYLLKIISDYAKKKKEYIFYRGVIYNSYICYLLNGRQN